MKYNHEAIDKAINVPLQQDMCSCGHARAFHPGCCKCVDFVKGENHTHWSTLKKQRPSNE